MKYKNRKITGLAEDVKEFKFSAVEKVKNRISKEWNRLDNQKKTVGEHFSYEERLFHHYPDQVGSSAELAVIYLYIQRLMSKAE